MCVCVCVPAFLLKPQKSWRHQGACCPISGSPMVLWHVESYSSDVQGAVLKLQNWLIIRHFLDGSYFRWINRPYFFYDHHHSYKIEFTFCTPYFRWILFFFGCPICLTLLIWYMNLRAVKITTPILTRLLGASKFPSFPSWHSRASPLGWIFHQG